MRIYFSASQSSGKTTLARYFSNKYKLELLPEVARQVLSKNELAFDTLRADLDITNSYQSEVFYKQIEVEKNKSSFVSDRCLIDALAYCIQHSSIGSSLFWGEEYKNYIERLKQKDVILFFIRPSKTIMKQDGVRENLSFEGMISIDAIIKTLLELNQIQYFQIDTESAQERIKLIDNIVNLHQ